MIVNRSIGFTLLAISSLLFSQADSKIIACSGGDEDSDDYFYTFFDPENTGVESYFFLDNYLISPEIETEDANTAEWITYLNDGNNNGKRDWSYFIHHINADTYKELIAHRAPSIEVPDAALACTFIIEQPKFRPAKDYLLFAKEAEKYTDYYTNWWEEKPAPDDGIYPMQEQAKKGLKTSLDPFLKQRYGFQLQRLYFQNGQYQEAVDLYKKELVQLTASPSISERSAGFLSASYYALQDYTTANLMYARQFAQNLNSRSALWSFHVQDENEWKQTLQKATTKEDKIALWFMLGYYSDPLRAMKEIYPLDPNCGSFKILMSRAINAEEQHKIRFNTDGYWSPYSKIDFDPELTGEPLYEFAKKVNTELLVNDRCFWNVAAAHLAYLKGDNNACKEWLSKASLCQPTQVQKTQIKITTILNDLSKNKLDKAGEPELVSNLNWLFQNTKPDSEKVSKTGHTLRYMLIDLSKRYAEAGNEIYAELLGCQQNWTYLFHSNFYSSEERTQQMLDLIRKKDKSVLERLLVNNYAFNEKDVVDWQTILLVYKDDLDAASKKAAEPGEFNDANFPGDPFVIHIQDCHDCDHAVGNNAEWTKSNLIDKMIELKQKIAKNENMAESAYKLGNAYYNITEYGNTRAMYASNIAQYQPTEINEYDDNPRPVVINIFNMAHAKKYYSLAYKYETNRERKAELCWLLAKCELNDFYNGDVEIPEKLKKLPKVEFVLGPHSKEFAMNYKDTKYYKEALKQCGYFRKIAK